MTKVKICGINDPVAFDAAVAAGADWVGFNFFPPSPRFVTPDEAAVLSGRAGKGVLRVGLFVEPTLQVIEDTLARVELDILQVYGAVGLIPAIRARFGLPVWRAMGVGCATDLPTGPVVADALVLEAKPPAGADRPGGNARSFDWSVLSGWTAPAPWILAGGLTVDTVGRAIGQTGVAAVDVSSGVERSPGVKDPGLIRAFIAAAKGRGVRDG